MDDDQPEASGSPPNPDATRRACDACRARKIRCDRESPCSHCITSKLVCLYTPVRPAKKRTRILLTPQYERKIDLIDNRLERAIKLLEKLHTNGPSDPGNSRPPRDSQTPARTPSSIAVPASDPAQERLADGQVIGGDSSLAAHSIFANKFLQEVAATHSLRDSSPELNEALDELSCMLTPQAAAGGEMAYQHARPIERASLAGCEMPPVKEAFALIRIAKTAQLAGTGWVYEFLPFQRFTDMCLEVYFNEHHSEANFLTVNAGLHSLFWDYSFHVSAHEREEYVRHSHMCRDNLETALSNLPLHLPATSDMVAALLFGACYAIEISKPNLSWTLSAKASELCQTLGYHRIASMKDDKEEDVRYKRFLLWSIYFIDKCLSLRLGRPSTIPDWDITIPRPSTSDLHSEPVFAYFVLWVEAARCQGNIYEMLYSPNAIAQPNQVRQSRVEALVSDLQNLDIATLETNEKWLRQAKEKSGEDLMDFFYISDHVLRLSLLTLVHRAAPRDPGSLTTFDSNCVAAAIATLQQHEECIAVIRKSTTPYLATYVHWTLLFTPFIPFIVIFCHVIETHDEENLARLQTFVTSIQSAAPVSNPAAKLYRLFDVLCKIASSYLELRISTSQGGPGQGSSKVGAYLDSLGFSSIIGSVPSQQPLGPHQGNPGAVEGFGPYNAEAGAGGAGDGLRAINPLIWAANGADLEDWLQNNEVMTELMQGSETL